MALIESMKDGRPLYRVRWNYRTENGKRRHDERVFRKRTEARAWERQVTASDTPRTERITVNQLADEWVARHVHTDAIEERTRRDYLTQLNLRIRPGLGTERCAKLTPAKVAAWQRWITSQTRTLPDGRTAATSAHTSNKSLRVFRAMLRWGYRQGLHTSVADQYSRSLKVPPPSRAKAYTPAEVARIMDGCELLRDAALVAVMAYAGLRWSEARGLRWSDVNLATGDIDLRTSIDVNQERKGLKTHAVRTPTLLAVGMKRVRAWRKMAPDTDLMFPNEHGRPIDNWHKRSLPAIRRASGIHFNPHQLRSTYSSLLIAAGASEVELTMTLGHVSVQLTRAHYADEFDQRRKGLADRANLLLGSL